MYWVNCASLLFNLDLDVWFLGGFFHDIHHLFFDCCISFCLILWNLEILGSVVAYRHGCGLSFRIQCLQWCWRHGWWWDKCVAGPQVGLFILPLRKAGLETQRTRWWCFTTSIGLGLLDHYHLLRMGTFLLKCFRLCLSLKIMESLMWMPHVWTGMEFSKLRYRNTRAIMHVTIISERSLDIIGQRLALSIGSLQDPTSSIFEFDVGKVDSVDLLILLFRADVVWCDHLRWKAKSVLSITHGLLRMRQVCWMEELLLIKCLAHSLGVFRTLLL